MKDLPTFGVAETTPISRQPRFRLKSSRRALIRLKLRERASMLSKPKMPRDLAVSASHGISTAVPRAGIGMTERELAGSALNDDTPAASWNGLCKACLALLEDPEALLMGRSLKNWYHAKHGEAHGLQ